MSSELPIGTLNKQDFHFRTIIHLEEASLNLSGLHPEHLPNLFGWGILTPVLPLMTMVYLMVSSATALYFYDFDLVAESIMLGLGVLRFVSKLFIFLHQRKYFFEMLEAFEDPVFYSFTQEDLEHIRTETDKTKLLRTMHYVAVFTYAGFLGVSPFIFNLRVQVVPVWEPMDLGFFTFVCHLFATCFTAYNHVSLDTIYTMVTTFACCQFDIIINSFKRMDFRNHDESEEVLRAHIIRHLRILGFVDLINNLVRYMALVQYLISIFIICVTMFQVVKASNSGSNIAFLICMIVEIIRYCWFGEAIKDKNEELNKALYLSNWEESNLKTRKMMLIMRERCQRSILLDVGGFTSMSLNSFVNIMRSAYSSFTVLRQVYN